tara:strand:+ start:14 stop:181 length:168 start_codon:yes stop_codon:yes gene_type:complete
MGIANNEKLANTTPIMQIALTHFGRKGTGSKLFPSICSTPLNSGVVFEKKSYQTI